MYHTESLLGSLTNFTFTRFVAIDYMHPSSAGVANTWSGGA